MSDPNVVNEALIRQVVEEVLGRLGQTAPGSASSCGRSSTSRPRHFGVFTDANEACEAAGTAFRQLSEQGVAARNRVVEIVKTLADTNAAEWGRIELEETRIGRLDHKIDKLKGLKFVPGVEFLRPDGYSGDHGIMLEEWAPFGVIGAITPSTHSIP
ncbi:MAG TPA: aldehyde dehydrogenase EutE, partial [Candidatus Paceibacterota bacterium]|nr:aldehyde dehydrogenase EutE [Candidatus Paceibacterota bacterium]